MRFEQEGLPPRLLHSSSFASRQMQELRFAFEVFIFNRGSMWTFSSALCRRFSHVLCAVLTCSAIKSEPGGFMAQPVAHTSVDGRYQLLSDHLTGTAKKAAEMAAEFGAGQWAYLGGLWHDLGKFAPEFQQYIRADGGPEAHMETSQPGRVDHSTAGAIWAIRQLQEAGKLLAYSIAGHHAGLPDYESDATGNAALSVRLRKKDRLNAALAAGIPPAILSRALPTERPKRGADPALWVRLIFSCLVDADFLDTEGFLQPEQSALRGTSQQLSDLLPLFHAYMHEKCENAPASQVNRIRAEVLSRCLAEADGPSGVYSLTVPTGGGKTLSSMAFALNHAVKHGQRRIIYVIPYTSIIEQTAEQFRTVFGDAIVEHQSNLDVSDQRKDNARTRLACENWDAPIVVTTSVQFFESLFASRTSRCRKLHNVVNSVVVLDEVQLLPPELLKPILHILDELRRNYGVTFVLSTATQPALGPHKSFDFDFPGLPHVQEIVENPMDLHARLKRVEVTLPTDLSRPTSWGDIAAELSQYPSVLCVVNRRDDCRELWNKMPRGTFHLSALMCGAHRSVRIAQIKERLGQGMPTRVISTQLVEAGVDLDFPVVYRALAGLDSIAQAAGRCNREGLLPGKGRVVVFVPPSSIPAGHLRQAAEIGRRLMSQHFGDVLAPDRFEAFFRELYWLKGPDLDKHGILADLQMTSDFRCSFRSAAQKFRLIDESGQAPVIVTWRQGTELIQALDTGEPNRFLLRRLQRYVVNLPRYIHVKLLAEGVVREVHPGIYVQAHPSLYDEELGFCPDRRTVYGADELIV